GTYTLSSIGNVNGFVVKLNAGGEFGWASQVVVNGTNLNVGGMAVDGQGNVYTVASSNGVGMGLIATRHDSQGNHAWTRGTGDRWMYSGDLATAWALVYVAWSCSGMVVFDPRRRRYNLTSSGTMASPNQAACVLVLMNAGGDFTWAKHFQASGKEGFSG